MPAALAIVWIAVVAQRLWELRVSARHERALRSRGGYEVPGGRFPAIALAHAAWLAGWPLEVAVLGTRPPAAWPLFAMIYLAAEGLRLWAVASLGERWTVRVLRLPGEPLVTAGPYRWLRHPNYLAVAVETLCGPLVFGAWRTAIAGPSLYLLALALRLPAEARALERRAAHPLDRSGSKP